VEVTDGVTQASQIQMTGNGTIIDNASAMMELWIRGQTAFQHADIAIAPGATNAGTIRLESTDSTWRSRIVTGAGDLTSTGDIISRLGAGGERSIQGTLVNAGRLIVEDGVFFLNGTYDAAGGSIEGAGDFAMPSGTITMSAAAPGTGNLIATAAPGVTIASGNMRGYEVWVRGRSAYSGGHTLCTIGVPMLSNGTLRLQSSDTTWNSNLTSTSGSVTFGAGLQVHVNTGSGGARSFLMNVTSGGTIAVEAGTVPTITGTYSQTAGGTFFPHIGGTTSAGRMTVTGAITLDGTIMSDFTGGFVPDGDEMYTVLSGPVITGEFGTWDLQALSPTGPEHVLYVPPGAPTSVKILMCYADCDGSAVLDIFDFLCFGNRFSSLDQYACNCDRTTGPDTCDIFDFLCFGNAFSVGCP
jgi:hypothetical protein